MSKELETCPKCGGHADNGFSREIPPSPYYCRACMAEDRIEELKDKVDSLEREIDAYESWKDIIKQRDALLADNARLREALERLCTERRAGLASLDAWVVAREALAATPAQSLARYHNEALEKAEKVCEQATTIGACIAAIRELKEPECSSHDPN